MTAIAVIPARMGSTRLPGKVLASLMGRPMVWHVWNRANQASRLAAVIVATDSNEVRTVVEGWGGTVLMTSEDCQSGTERIASVIGQLEADLILNIQGDEPLVDPAMLDSLVEHWEAEPCDLITPVFCITHRDDLTNPNIVKVARTEKGRALYFSRSPIPFVRDYPADEWLHRQSFWGHVGVYGYRRDVLAQYPNLQSTLLEQAEQLEQLRFLDYGYSFQTIETQYRPVAVDTVDDLDRVQAILGQRSAHEH